MTAQIPTSGWTAPPGRAFPAFPPARLALLLAAANVVLVALLALAQWAAWGGAQAAAEESAPLEALLEGGLVVATDLGYGFLVIAVVFAGHPLRRRWPARLAVITAAALVFSVPRALVLLAVRSTPGTPVYITVESLAGAVAVVIAVATALFAAGLVERMRREARRRRAATAEAARAVEELQDEELRVRRMVADQLHGSLQHRLVTVTAALDALAARVEATGAAAGHETAPTASEGAPELAAELRGLAETVEEIREADVRSLSHAVFPAGADISVIDAIAIMLRRLPPSIATTLTLGPVYRALVEQGVAPLPLAERLIAVYAVEEAVTNALKHGHARTAHISAEIDTTPADRWILVVVVDDDGAGPPAPVPTLSGLERHRARIVSRGGGLELGAGPNGGGRLRFRLPFEPPHHAESDADADE